MIMDLVHFLLNNSNSIEQQKLVSADEIKIIMDALKTLDTENTILQASSAWISK